MLWRYDPLHVSYAFYYHSCSFRASFGQSGRSTAVPKFAELSREDNERLDQQRAIIAAVANPRPTNCSASALRLVTC